MNEDEPIRPGTETRCIRCSYRGVFQPRELECPTCGGGLLGRVAPAVSPGTHGVPLFRAVLSVRGVTFAFVYAVLALAPIPFSGFFAYLILGVAAIHLAWRAMLAPRQRVEFPEITLELIEFRWLVPVSIFLGAFVLLPTFLLGAGVGTGVSWLGGLAFLLLAWAPVGLLGYLRHGSALGFVWPDTGLTLTRRDPVGVVLLTVGFVGLLYGGGVLDVWLSSSLLGSLLGCAVWAFCLLYAFGIAGLFLRKHCRALGLDLDSEEWSPARVVNVSLSSGMPRPPAPASPFGEATPPPIVGTLIDPDAR